MVSTQLLKRTQAMLNKYRLLLLEESRVSPASCLLQSGLVGLQTRLSLQRGLLGSIRGFPGSGSAPRRLCGVAPVVGYGLCPAAVESVGAQPLDFCRARKAFLSLPSARSGLCKRLVLISPCIRQKAALRWAFVALYERGRGKIWTSNRLC